MNAPPQECITITENLALCHDEYLPAMEELNLFFFFVQFSVSLCTTPGAISFVFVANAQHRLVDWQFLSITFNRDT